MTHASAEDARAAPPRAESLAKINAMTAKLRELHVSPPDPYAWSRHRRSQWWAFGEVGRYTVTVADKFGWAVGDYPWEGAVHDRSGISNEIFVKPTFVDADGHLVPIDAVRVLPQVNYLLTDEMCRDIADRMEQIVAQATSAAAAEKARQRNEAGRHSTQNAQHTEHAEAGPFPRSTSDPATHDEAEAAPGPSRNADPVPEEQTDAGPIPAPRRGPLDSEPRLPDFASLIDPTKGSTK